MDNRDPIIHLHPRPLPADVTERIHRAFPGKVAVAVEERLNQLRREDPKLFGDRIVRCIVFCTWRYPSMGIDIWIQQVRTDFRDLIVAAEYDRNYRQLRDFNRPFRDEDFFAENRIRSMTKADIEMLWINAWSDLYEIVQEQHDVRCLLPDGEVVDVEECKGWLQDSAYSGYVPAVTARWVLGKRGVIASRTPISGVPPHPDSAGDKPNA